MIYSLAAKQKGDGDALHSMLQAEQGWKIHLGLSVFERGHHRDHPCDRDSGGGDGGLPPPTAANAGNHHGASRSPSILLPRRIQGRGLPDRKWHYPKVLRQAGVELYPSVVVRRTACHPKPILTRIGRNRPTSLVAHFFYIVPISFHFIQTYCYSLSYIYIDLSILHFGLHKKAI